MKTTTVKNYNCAVRTTYTETNDLFPREQHPDKRTNAQFLIDMGMKKVQKRLHSGKWYPLQRQPGRTGRPVRCINTGKTYDSIRDAANDLKLDNTNLGRHLKGHIKLHPCKGV